jgi:hypothetical protein
MFKVEVIADNSGEWVGNQKVYDTKELAEAAARDLESRWTAVRQWRVVEIPLPASRLDDPRYKSD